MYESSKEMVKSFAKSRNLGKCRPRSTVQAEINRNSDHPAHIHFSKTVKAEWEESIFEPKPEYCLISMGWFAQVVILLQIATGRIEAW